jgi:hypothetical protein
LVLVDLAVQAVHVANQSRIYALRREARSRLAGAYMLFYSAGIAGGALAATATYAWAGWTAVCALGAAISLAAFAVWLAALPRDAVVGPTTAEHSSGGTGPYWDHGSGRGGIQNDETPGCPGASCHSGGGI